MTSVAVMMTSCQARAMKRVAAGGVYPEPVSPMC